MIKSRVVVIMPAAVVAMIVLAPTAPASNNGAIRGRVINESIRSPQAGIQVTLASALPDGTDRFVRTSRTDTRGRYSFGALPTGDERKYSVSVIFEGGMFTGKPIDELGTSNQRTVVDGTLRIWETISDPEVILIQRHNIFASQGEEGLGIIEALTIVNTSSDRAYVGRARSFGLENARVTVAFALPSDASDGRMLAESDFVGTPIAATDSGFGLSVAIPPGTHRVLFAYRLPGSAGTYELSRTALYPTLTTAVHITDGLRVDSNRLAEAGTVTIGNTRYARWSSDEVVEAGEAIQMQVTAEAGTSGWLLGGAVAAVLLAGALFALSVMRNRRPSPPLLAEPPPSSDREALVAEIAALDIRHEAGRLGDAEWNEQRAELKERLAGLSVPEPSR